MAAAVFAVDVDSAVDAHSEAVVLFVGAGSGAVVRFERVVFVAGASIAPGAIAGAVIGAGASMATGAIAAVAIFVDATALGAATMAMLRTRRMGTTTVIRAPG